MSNLHPIIAGSVAMALLACLTTPAQAGLFCDRAPACCAPAPVCCAPEPVCCPPAPICCPPPPPPVQVCWCVVDPCTGCEYQVEACVPACCAGVAPTLDDCRRGLFGRIILTYKFGNCDHCVDVVITKHGRTIVRD